MSGKSFQKPQKALLRATHLLQRDIPITITLFDSTVLYVCNCLNSMVIKILDPVLIYLMNMMLIYNYANTYQCLTPQ